MGASGGTRKTAIKAHLRNALYIAAGIASYVIASPRQLARRLLGKYTQKKVAAELQRFINLYMASALLQRLLILSLIAIFYVVTKELRLNTELYVAIITALIGLYTCSVVVIGACMYLGFCARHKIGFSPWLAARHYTADEIKHALDGRTPLARLLLRVAVGNTEAFAQDVAHSAIYSAEIKRLIYWRAVYYLSVAGIYLLGYNLLYYKLIAIDFTNFIHPFTWAWHYLVAAAA